MIKRLLMADIFIMLILGVALAGCGSKKAEVSGPEKEEENVISLSLTDEVKPVGTVDVNIESYRVLKRAGAGQEVFLQEDISPLIEEAKKKAAAASDTQMADAKASADTGESADAENAGPEETEDGKKAEPEETGDDENADGQQEKDREAEEKDETAAEAPKSASGTGKVVCIDAGHQRKQNSAQEPVGPGASSTKMKVTSGTSGSTTGVPEYQLTLAVALKLQSVLQQRGYTVVMCRSSHDVDISNVERAQVANNAGAGAFIRIHADGSNNSSAAGASTLAPSASNPYCAQIASSSQSLAKNVINSYCAKTGMKNRGMQLNDGMTGLNWSQVPVTIIEMGFMTNPSDDQLMETESFQQSAAEGIADGIDAYFASR
ncbi:MAG: N-acetylmuramoyl-L-alanine amidase [Lachnospiraceae bacterium]|nr:N-acetylmuramoyl-L-alanine amidase [Lachnospiraceae bacterium]